MSGDTGPLGPELRRLRGSTSLRDLAQRLAQQTGREVHHGTIGRYETGRSVPSPDRLAEVLDALGVENAERERLLDLVRRPGPGELVAGVPATGRQLAQLIGYERAAARITEVAFVIIPGLLQTRAYARAVLGEPDTAKRVQLRMERAEILTRAQHPVELRVILHVEALTRPVAPAAVIREQLAHVRHMAGLPNVTVQVVPADAPGWLPSFAGPFMLIEFDDAAPVVHLEHYRAGAFLWEDRDVRSFMAAANEMAQKAMTPARSAEVIAELAQGSRHDGTSGHRPLAEGKA